MAPDPRSEPPGGTRGAEPRRRGRGQGDRAHGRQHIGSLAIASALLAAAGHAGAPAWPMMRSCRC